MKGHAKSMRFVVGKQNVALVCLNHAFISDEPLRPMKFVLHNADNGDHEACTFQYIARGTQLRFAAIDDKYPRQRPFRVVQAARQDFFERGDIVIRRGPHGEFPVCRFVRLAVVDHRHDTNGLLPRSVCDVERLDARAAAGRNELFIFDERYIANVLESRYLSVQFFCFFKILLLCGFPHLAGKLPFQALKISREELANFSNSTCVLFSRNFPCANTGT